MGLDAMTAGFATTEIGSFGISGTAVALRIAPDKTFTPLLSEERTCTLEWLKVAFKSLRAA
ncbi:MAG: hypothetical protein RL630_1801 [Verrucomicrobiota bacterium]|jgi:hypothetical protein